MKIIHIIFTSLILLTFFVLSSTVNAVQFGGIATGEWVDVVSNHYLDVYSVDNNDSGDVAAFNWGTPAPSSSSCQFTFDGIGSDDDPFWIANDEEAFLIGNFNYYNGAVGNALGIDGIGLNIMLEIINPINVTESYDFSFTMTNTPNTTGNNVLDGDIVTLNSSVSATVFSYQDIDYTLELLGFSTDGGNVITTDFSSPEYASAAAGLYARITSTNINNEPVPEPSTIILLGAGLLLLVGARIRIQQN